MKRLSKLFVNLLAILMVATCCLSLTGCGEDIKKAELSLQIYNYEDAEFNEDTKFKVDLYAHLAPKTCEAMVSYINEGYYDNALIYKVNNNIMFGDLVLDGDSLVIEQDGAKTNVKLNAIKPTLPGEFEAGGTVGSNLKNERGSIGLWRTYSEAAGSFTTSSGLSTGRATWFMPTVSNASYNGYYCVFGLLDMEDEATSNSFSALESIFNDNENSVTLVIYYTGEYDANNPNNNYGLTFNCVTKDYYKTLSEDELDGVFEAEGSQLTCYNKYEIKVAVNGNGKAGAIVKSASVK